MKTYSILLLIFFTAFAENLNAQCEVDAGANVHLCYNEFTGVLDTGSLNAKVLLGTPPFKFQWEANHPFWNNQFTTASDVLEETNVLNPKIQKVYPSNDLIAIWLTVTDSTGSVCRDTTYVSLSVFNSLSVDIGAQINQGDTTNMDTRAFNDFTPFSINWTPNYNISDTTSFGALVWPDTNTIYTMVITDSVGCSFKDWFPVEVLTVSTENLLVGTEHFRTFPNPNKGIFFFEKTDHSPMNGMLELLDLSGKIIFSKKVKNQIRGEIDLPNLPKGNYFIRLLEREKVLVGQIRVL